jgi:outer membrane protein assembly factor BamB
MYQYSPGNNAVFDLPDWNARWSLALGATTNGGISIVGDNLYIETYKPSLLAVDAQSGKLLWEAPLENIAMNAPIVSNGVVIVGTGENKRLSEQGTNVIYGRPEGDYVIGFDAKTGKRLWSFHTVGENMPTGALAIAGNHSSFIFSNGDAHIYALDTTNGRLLWETEMPGESMMSSLSTYNGLVYGMSTVFVSQKYWDEHFPPTQEAQANAETLKRTWAIDPTTGSFRWVGYFGYTDGTPSLGSGMLFNETFLWDDPRANEAYNIFYAADAASGAIQWKYRSVDGPKPLLGSDELAVASMYDAGVVYTSLPVARQFDAFDAVTGRLRWSTQTREAVKMSSVISNGLIYFGDTGGWFYILKAADGSIVQNVRFPELFRTSPPVIVGRTLFVADNTHLYAIPLEDLARGLIPQ